MKGVIVQFDVLINQIQSDYSKRIQYKVDEPFPINIYKPNNSSDKSLNDDFVYSQLLIDSLLQMKTISTDKIEFINLCSNQYHGNNHELSIIQEFEQKYISNQALWWYTRESFLSRLLNKALSIKNLDLLFLFTFLIRDMQTIIQKNKSNSCIQVYHGQVMSMDELCTFKNAIGDYISINTFFSAKFNRKQIMSALNEFTVTDDVVRILFEIDADPSIGNPKPFAMITQFTYFPEEKQVLFMLGAIFQVIDITHDKKNDLWIVKIVLTNIKKEYNETNLLSCGYSLQDMGKFDDAEKYFSRLLKELPENHEDISKCYHSLGLLSFLKTNYDQSLSWYHKLINILKANNSNLADSYYSIGCVYQKINDNNQALEYYNKALHIWNETYGDNEPLQMAECFNNIGCIYEIEKSYSQALKYHQKALSIREKFQTDIGSTYNNIGNIYLWLGENDVALANYLYSFDIKSQSLTAQDPSVATTLENIGLVYEKDRNFEEALKYYRRAACIFEKKFPSTHIYNIEIQENIQHISSLLK